MRAFKRFIFALLSFLLLFIFASFLSVTPGVSAIDRYSSLSVITFQPSRPTRYFPKPTWWLPSNPSTTPKPTNIPIPPYLSDGTVTIAALVTNCGNKSPYAGVFQLCEGKLAPYASENNAFIPHPSSFSMLNTDGNGEGKLTTHTGYYTIYPPLWCPPGAYCIANQSGKSTYGKLQLLDGARPLIADPYTWDINPQNFFLPPGGSVNVSTVGHNRLLMCPIQVEE